MLIVGIRDSDLTVHAGALSEDGARVAVLATLEEFWATPRRWMPAGGDGVEDTAPRSASTRSRSCRLCFATPESCVSG